MAVRRSGNDDDDGGLDSLLDTMTNVVGILVLVLIVTQMSVADVVSKVIQENQVDTEQLETVKAELREKKEEEKDLERILISPLDIDSEKQKEELQKKKELLERRKKLLEEKKKEQNQFALKIKEDKAMAEANLKKIADTEAKRNELQTLITTTLDEKAKLEAMLSKTPRKPAPADIKVSIPNPRPPPQGAKQVPIICAENKVYPLNIEVFRKRAELRAKEIIARARIQKDPVKGYDPATFAKFWEKLKDQDMFFDVEYYIVANRHLRLRFIPREGRGGTDRQLINPRSAVRAEYLNLIDPAQYYARFYVLPDSYDVYVTARRLFNKSGLLSGWDPQNQDWQYTSHVPGGIELGPPIEKKPAPPGPPRKPQNLID
ncbi:MAG: hypothetical protein HKN47_20425 [Pirellulaceae bacterium]|nr:hypothetical protein [Pirellulaceae bacterium]